MHGVNVQGRERGMCVKPETRDPDKQRKRGDRLQIVGFVLCCFKLGNQVRKVAAAGEDT